MPIVYFKDRTVRITLIFVALTTLVLAQGFVLAQNRKHECGGVGGRVEATVTNDQGFWPKTIKANVCDTLVIQNNSTHVIEVALGTHEHHVPYPGFAEEPTKPSASKSFQLLEKGEYLMHDHLNDDHQARLIIE